MRLIKVFVVSPEAFEYALEGIPFEKYVAGLFTVAPTRKSGSFGAKVNYRQDKRFANTSDPLRVSA